MGDPPTKDFLRWQGVKFRDQKKQNPGPEKAATLDRKRQPLVVRKRQPPEAESGPEKAAKGNAESGPEKAAITKSYHWVGAVSARRPPSEAGVRRPRWSP